MKAFAVRRITTEKADNYDYMDFVEFYRVHLMHGATWGQVCEDLEEFLKRFLERGETRRVRSSEWLQLDGSLG